MITDRHLPALAPADDWRDASACLDLDDPNEMFPSPTDILGIEDAKDICRRCPVLRDCRTWALSVPELHGVWGGLSEDERYQHLGRRRPPSPDAPPAPPRSQAPCGTEAGYKRHIRHKSRICTPCQIARSRARAERRRAKQQEAVPP